MSNVSKNDNKIVKVAIVSAGLLLIGGGLGPTILDYLSAQNVQENNNNEPVVEQTEQQIQNVEVVTTEKNISEKSIVSVKEKTETQTAPQMKRKPLPLLHDSDPFIMEEYVPEKYKAIFVNHDLINKMVVFVDNFSRGILVTNFSPLISPKKPFVVKEQNGTKTIDSQSYLRYDDYSNLISSINTETFIETYNYLSPLIDQSYQEIGYPKGAFTNTLVNAIDTVLDTPVLRYKLEVVSPSAMYEYKDKNLESLPTTQKLMMRMGPENLQKIQNKLQQIKTELQNL